MRGDVSVVLPVYDRASGVAELIARLRAALPAAGLEIVLVHDGGPPESLETLRALADSDSSVRVVELAGNQGQNAAVLAGLRRTGGDLVVVMDADLQDPPEAVPSLLAAIRDRWDTAFGGRRGAYEARGRLAGSRALKLLLHLLSRRRLPADAGLFVAMRREVVVRLLRVHTREPYVVGLLAHVGGRMTSLPVPRLPSPDAGSGYGTVARLRLARRAIATVSRPPRGA